MKLFSLFKTPIIEFLCEEKYYNAIPEPEPAYKNFPEWYKKIPPFCSQELRGPNGGPMMTAKKCMPMIDAMSLGYVIPFMMDQYIKTDTRGFHIDHGPALHDFGPGLEFHELQQVRSKDNADGPFKHSRPIKFINPWVVKTAPGWSTLFIQSINTMEDRFQLLGGLVDTDKYPKQVNFPGKWIKPLYDGYIRAGTPMMTAIPIKRDNLTKDYTVRKMNKDEFDLINTLTKKQMSRENVYTNELRVKK